MPNFVFGQRARGNVFSLQDARGGNATTKRRTPISANPYSSPSCAPNSTYSSGGQGGNSGHLSGSGGYQINRFNPAYDRLEEGSVIEDWIPRDLAGINKMFRIIYARDAICGPAIDIQSNLPWSEFDIQGVEDPAIRKFYEDAAQIFGDKAQEMPAMTTEFLVLGRFCASLLFSESKGYWTDFVPHDSDFLTITPIPVRGFDPKLDLMLSPGNRQFINSMDYRDQAATRVLPAHLIAQMRSGQPLPLDPLNTLYLHRKTSPTDFVGTSLLTRILPFWALEKALMNATVTAARRRASNILHLTIGIEDKWEPTQEEMEDVAGLFIQADEDPVGAVVATRTGVEASEIRDAGSLWKWSDEWSNFAEGKMRGLGISEALLAGDATYNNMDQAKSTFVEQVKTMREYITQNTYYKLFKILARAHGFRKRKQADLDHRVRTNPAEKPPEDEIKIRSYEDINLKDLAHDEALEIPEEDLIIPKVHWRKSLEPEGDREYLDILESIADKGVPIPIRVWAARAGYDIDEAMDMLDDDAKLRERIVKWKDATAGEDDAWGAVDAPPEEPFWDVGQRFLQLSKDDAKSCVQALVNICHQPGKSEVLGDTDFVQRVISEHVRGSDFKRELMNYVLMRMGVATGLPLSDNTVTAIVEHYAKSGYTAERKANEFRFLAKLSGKGSRVSQANIEKLAAASLRLVSDKNSELGEKVRTTLKSKDVAPTAPTLLSGSTR